MNQAFSALLNEKIELFKHSLASATRQAFVDPATGKLLHAGEFGTYREGTVRDFLRLCVPARLDIGTGFLINAAGEVSTQADVVVYDRSAIPRVESSEHQRFFPVEGVCAVGEVKSRLSKTGLREALNKLARVKAKGDQLSSKIPIHRDRVLAKQDFNRETVLYDQLFSFLVCEGFDFDPSSLAADVAGWYEPDVRTHHQHNLVLSVADGLLLYADVNAKSWMYPSSPIGKVKNRFVRPAENKGLHFHLFCSYMYSSTSSATILFPEMTAYMPEGTGGHNHDEP